jgi:DNA-binding transcriptional ArsR family regulator
VETNQRRELLLDALGDPTRRAIIEVLAEGALPVGQLAARLPISRPAVSQHLKVLKEAGLVVDTAAGTRRLYHLIPDGVDALRAWLDRVWTSALAAFKAAAEKQEEA